MRKFFKRVPFYKVFVFLFVVVYTFLPSVQAVGVVIDDYASEDVNEGLEVDTSEDILDEGISDPQWIANPELLEDEEEADEPLFVYEDGVYTVFSVIEGEEYVYPGNEDVRITFTSVTEDGDLIIDRVDLTDEQREELNTTDEYGWSITSSMENYSFTYDLTLPNTLGNDVEVKYGKEGSNEFNGIEDVVVNEDVIHIYGLDHFTLFVVVSPLPDSVSEGEACTVAEIEGVCYETIQAAIDAANPNSTVRVESGEYNEDISIDKTGITLKSISGPNNTSIVGDSILITESDISLEGFTIDNEDRHNGRGIWIKDESHNVTIDNNIFVNSFRGIQGNWSGSLQTSGLKVTNNIFEDSISYGIAGTENFVDLLIEDNVFETSEEGIGVGEGISFYTGTDFSDLFSENTFDISGGFPVGDYRDDTLMPTKYISEGHLLVQAGDSIQDVIDVANDGDTIKVEAGTYNEALEILTDNISLKSVEGAPETIIDAQGATNAIAIGEYNKDGIHPENVTIEGFTVTGWAERGIGQRNGDKNVYIYDNILQGPSSGSRNAINTSGGSSSEIIGNTIVTSSFDQENWSGTGILLMGSNGALVKNNEIVGADLGIVVAGYPDWESNDPNWVSASENTIKGNEISNSSSGIALAGNTFETNLLENKIIGNNRGINEYPQLGGVPRDTVVENNDIKDNSWGIRISSALEEDPLYSAPMSFLGNEFDNNLYQIRDFSDSVDLEQVLDENSFDRAVVVKDNPIVIPTIFSSIQDAIDHPSTIEGHTIEVLPGTYQENIDIDKDNLTLVGPNSGIPGNETRGDEAFIEGQITFRASGLTLDGFKVNFDGDSAPVDIGRVADPTVINNRVFGENKKTAGIQSWRGVTSGTITIQNNQVTDGPIGVMSGTHQPTIIITDNEILGAGHEGIWTHGGGEYITLRDNIVINSGQYDPYLADIKIQHEPSQINSDTDPYYLFGVAYRILQVNNADTVQLWDARKYYRLREMVAEFSSGINGEEGEIGYCNVYTNDLSHPTDRAKQVLSFTKVEEATSYTIVPYSWNGSNWEEGTRFNPEVYANNNDHATFSIDNGVVTYTTGETNEGIYTYQAIAYSNQGIRIGHSQRVTDFDTACKFTVDRTAPSSELSFLGDHYEAKNRTLLNSWRGFQWFYNFTEIELLLEGEENDFIKYGIVNLNEECDNAEYDTYLGNLASELNSQPNGVYRLCYYAEDLAGNQETPVNEQLLKFDNTKGTADITSISGNEYDDVYYTQSPVTISTDLVDHESGIARTRLYIRENNCSNTIRSIRDDSVVEARSTYTHTSTFENLDDGEYCVRVRGYDKAQNHTNVPTKHFVVDNKAPEIEILYPENNTVHSGTFDIQVKGTDELSGLEQFVVNIQYENSHIAPCVNEDAQGAMEHTVTCTIDTTQFSQGDGDYSIKTNVTDRAGNMSTTLTRHFVFDNTPPEGSIDHLFYSPDHQVEHFITNDNTPVLGGTCADNIGLSTVVLEIDGQEQTIECDNGIWMSNSFDELEDDTYTATLILTDLAGNETTVTEEIQIDTVAPTAEHTYYNNDVVTTDITYVQSVSQLSFLAEYFDDGSEIYQDSYVIFDSNEEGTRRTSNAYCGWRNAGNTLTITENPLTEHVPFTNCTEELSDGAYFIYHQVYDNATRKDIPTINQFRDVKGLHFVVDTTKPHTLLNDISDTHHNTQTINISGTSTDDNGIAEVRIYGSNTGEDSWTFLDTVTPDISGNWTYPATPPDEGVYDVKIEVVDLAGNIEELFMTNITVDETDPISTINSPSDGHITNETPVIEGETTDDFSVDYVVLSYTTYNPDTDTCGDTWTELATLNNPNNESPFEWIYDEDDWGLEDGIYCIKAQGTDLAGNTEETSILKNIIYDTTDPQVFLELLAGILSVSVEDILSGKDTIEVRIGDGEWLVYEETMNLNELVNNEPGTYTIHVRVTDRAGNTTTETTTFTIPAPQPTTAEEVLGAIVSPFTPQPAQAALGTGGYLLAQTPEEETEEEIDDTEVEDTEDVEEEDTDEDVMGTEDDNDIEEETGRPWWIYPLVIVPLLLIFIILWRRRKEEEEPQY